VSESVTPGTFAFLRERAAHNERAWFEANQPYLEEVRDPLLQLVAACAPALAKLSRHVVADPRVGGSLFRIHRDVRFARTHAAMSFRHAEAREKPAPLPEEDSLKRPPLGYAPAHPCIEDLRRRSFTTGVRFTEAQACADDFVDRFVGACRRATPPREFLSRALRVPW
jgi:uncharacterized protein (DUF2461 family)